MGMYDNIEIEGKCGQCGFAIPDWQTKGLSNNMDNYKSGQSIRQIRSLLIVTDGFVEIHTGCPKKSCNAWNEAWAEIKDGKLSGRILFQISKRR